MKTQNTTLRTRFVENANAVIVQNAYLGSKGPVSGAFELFDHDFSMRNLENGMLQISVILESGEYQKDDEMQTLQVPPWSCMPVIGYEGDVVAGWV